MNVDWRGLVFGLMMGVGGGLIGYEYGHGRGMQDSDTAAMSGFFDKCMVQDAPPFCWALMNATLGARDEPSRDNPFGLSNGTAVV